MLKPDFPKKGMGEREVKKKEKEEMERKKRKKMKIRRNYNRILGQQNISSDIYIYIYI